MTLEQKWEQIFTCENGYNQGNIVFVDVAVQTELVTVGGREAVWDENRVANGVIWFTSFVVVSVNKTEEYAGIGVGGWSRFGCYVLVEGLC
ncbi:unnamed protein product [Camellia sinensis]